MVLVFLDDQPKDRTAILASNVTRNGVLPTPKQQNDVTLFSSFLKFFKCIKAVVLS